MPELCILHFLNGVKGLFGFAYERDVARHHARQNRRVLDAARTDYLDLRGYSVARPATIRDILQPLRSAFFFDGAEVEGELCFFPADETPVARIGSGDLGAHEFGTDRPPPYEARRAATIELPRQITVQHLDPARDYQANSQRARRSTTPSDSDVSVDLPMVLDADTAKGIAERMVSMAWIGRDGFTYQLPVDYLHVEAGHKIVVPHDDGKDRTLRVARRDLRLPGSLLVECKTDGAAVLSRAASAAPATVPTQEVTLPGATTAHLLDLPTEDKIAGHSVGDRFVLLTGAVGIFRPVVEAAETGVARQFKAVSVGTELSSTTPQSFTHTGRWAKPKPRRRCPVHRRCCEGLSKESLGRSDFRGFF